MLTGVVDQDKSLVFQLNASSGKIFIFRCLDSEQKSSIVDVLSQIPSTPSPKRDRLDSEKHLKHGASEPLLAHIDEFQTVNFARILETFSSKSAEYQLYFETLTSQVAEKDLLIKELEACIFELKASIMVSLSADAKTG